MKKLVILLIAAMAFMMVGCFGDGDTELGWKNDNGSAGITNIQWFSHDAGGLGAANEWGENPVAAGETSEIQTTNTLNGSVECEFETAGGYITATSVAIEENDGTGSENAALVEGSTNILTITAGAK